MRNATRSNSPLWTVADTAAFLRLTPATVMRLARNGAIPGARIGRGPWRFRREELEKLLKGHANEQGSRRE
jgi:excisionase family DNA binding protein